MSLPSLKVGDRLVLNLTYEDYAELPNDGKRYQLLEGEIDVTPAPNTRHQRISRNLLFLMVGHVKARKLGAIFSAPADCILSANTVVQPDLLFVSRSRLDIVSPRGIEGPPDLVVEILSDGTRRVDRTTKMRIYRDAGVAEVWIVDPEAASLEVFVLKEGVYALVAALSGDQTYRSDRLEGLEIPLGEIFAEDPR